MTGRARLGLAVGAALALAAGSPPPPPPGCCPAPRPRGRGRAGTWSPARTPGTVVLDVARSLRWRAARGRVDPRPRPTWGVVRVRLRAGDGTHWAAPAARALLLERARRPCAHGPPDRPRPPRGAALSRGRRRRPRRARIVAQSPADRPGAPAVRSLRRPPGAPPAPAAASAWRAPLEPRPRPVCDEAPASDGRRDALIALRCMGDDPRVALEGPAAARDRRSPRAGTGAGFTLRAYLARRRRGGSDRLAMRASSDAGVTVAPLRRRHRYRCGRSATP